MAAAERSAEVARPSLHGLAASGDSETVRRHVIRDDGAGAHERSVADGDRGHKEGVRADERALADHGPVLAVSVVVARDGAGADVDLRPDARVAEIGKVADLGARTEIDVLDLDEADLGLRPQDAPGRRRAKGPTVPPDATWAPSRWLNA